MEPDAALFSPDGYGEVGDWVLEDGELRLANFEWCIPVTAWSYPSAQAGLVVAGQATMLC